ncbi:hypothetical protein HK104_011303 [Borealophlyctis nickersoniae]|nr:hypothetical protein HK104_011303 [Borealophlyctis nickersoniae]
MQRYAEIGQNPVRFGGNGSYFEHEMINPNETEDTMFYWARNVGNPASSYLRIIVEIENMRIRFFALIKDNIVYVKEVNNNAGNTGFHLSDILMYHWNEYVSQAEAIGIGHTAFPRAVSMIAICHEQTKALVPGTYRPQF